MMKVLRWTRSRNTSVLVSSSPQNWIGDLIVTLFQAKQTNRTICVLGITLKLARCLSSGPRTRHWSDACQIKYCSSAWTLTAPVGQAKLERAQRRAASFVTGDYKGESSVTSMTNNLGWTRLTQMYKIVNSLVNQQRSPSLS